MLNFVDFVLLILLCTVTAVVLIFATGIVHTKPGYVSVIEKHRKFYRLETRTMSYYLPFIYKKVAYYPTNVNGIIKTRYKKVITYRIVDVMKLYTSKIELKKLLSEEKNLEANLEQLFGIKIIKVE
ncbi:MAG: hypothetical protein MJ207_01995 [Bacilli bacterium]|nr:hypothetical protein [Bacilli bacterium]